MASQKKVKQYLASWFQLGKGIFFPKEGKIEHLQKIFAGNNYSAEFEQCWQRILVKDSECYLEGTEQTIQQLLSPAWDTIDCPRCELPVPLPVAGVMTPACTCFDLSSWPNSELPPPRFPIDSTKHLQDLQERLKQKEKDLT